MHVSDGVFSPQILAAGWAVAVAGSAIGLKKLNPDRVVPVAVFSSTFFLASLVHITVGPGSTHLTLAALTGLALGWSAFPALFVALFLQSVFFQFGGLAALGPNCMNMAVPAVLIGLCFRRAKGECSPLGYSVRAFIAGALGVLLASLMVSVTLGLSDYGLVKTAKILFLTHLPIAVIEGIITAVVVDFLRRVAPDLLMGVEKV